MTIYNKTSPYYKTSTENGYLDIMEFRDIPAERDDVSFTVTKNYEYRPDLLAYDLYGDVNLWWVFSMRNKNLIKDPIYDLESGLQIYLPKLTTIKSALGI
jgi:hypothetical protein